MSLTPTSPPPPSRHWRSLLRLARVGTGWAEQDAHHARHAHQRRQAQELGLVADLLAEAHRRLEGLRQR